MQHYAPVHLVQQSVIQHEELSVWFLHHCIDGAVSESLLLYVT